MDKQNRFDWNHFASIATILAVVLVFPIYLGNKIDNKIDNLQNKMEQNMNEFRSEMKNFHGKQCAFEVKLEHAETLVVNHH